MPFVLNKKGVTLLELIVVLAIVAILAAFAVPNYFDYLKRATIAENAAKMASELRYVRDYASARSIPCVFTITSPQGGNNGSYRFNETDENGSGIVLPSEPALNIPFPDNVTITCPTCPGNSLAFTATGQPEDDVTITLTPEDEDLAKTIIINQVTGLVTVQ